MASELLKRQALINKLKEPETANINFDLADSALDYSIESIEEDILPEEKPTELFEERERIRKQRLSDTLTKIGGGLMDESVDFIERENFKFGSIRPGKGPGTFRASVLLAPGETITVGDVTLIGPDTPDGSKTRVSKTFPNKKAAETFLKKAEKEYLGGKTVLSPKDLTKKFKEYKKKYPDRILDQEFIDLINEKHVDAYRQPFNVIQAKNRIREVAGLKGAGFAFEKLPKSKQNELINRFPEIYKKGYDFNTHRLGVPVSQAGNLYNEIYNTAIDVSKRWPSGGGNNKNKIWHAAYRSVVTGENLDKPKYKLFDIKKNRTLTPREVEKTNWAKKFKEAVFLDTETGKKFSYDGKVKGTTSLENYINKFSVPNNPDPNRFKNAVSKYELTQKIRGIKITTRDGKKMTLGGYLDNQTRPAWMKKGSPYGFLNNHHIFDITKNFWDTEPVLYKDNRNLNYFERSARNALIKAADLPEKEQTRILKPFVEKFKKLGPIQMKEGKLNLGEYDFNKVITSALDESDLPLSVIKNIKQKKLSALQEIYSRAGMNLDPALAARAVKEELIDPLRSRVPTGKGIRALSTAGKIALPETYFAPASIVLDTYTGRTPAEQVLNVATLGFGAPAVDAYKKAQVLKDLGFLSDYKKAMAKINRADQALAEEVETLGMNTPAEEFAAPEFTKNERLAALIGQVEDLKLKTRLEEKAAEYQKLRENQLKKGLLEVTPDEEALPEDVAIKPEIPIEEEEEEEKSLGFFDRITGNIPRDFMSKGGIMATRLGFASGTGPFPLRLMFMIKDRLKNLENSTFSNYNDVRMFGEQKGIENILTPYKNIPDKNKLMTALEDVEELKKIMPEEYQSILNDIANDTKQFNFKTANDRTKALVETLPSDIDFKKLSDELFPMPNPENPSMILLGPDNPVSPSRFKTTTEIDTFTGKGKRTTRDYFDEETGEFIEEGKFVDEEPLDEEFSKMIRDRDKPDETN